MPMRWRPLGVLVLLATSLTLTVPLPGSAQPAVADAPTVEWVRTSGDSVVEAETYDTVIENAPPEAPSEVAAAGPFQSIVAGDGFNAFGLPNYGDYTIRLVTSLDGNIEDYRTELQQMANEVNAHNGLSLQVAAGTIAPPANPNNFSAPTGEIRVMISLASPCGTLSDGHLGCGGVSSAVVVEGVARYASGVVWLSPTMPSQCQQPVASHEVGHALGLDHYDDLYLGQFQLMKSSTNCSFSALRAGDLNGMRWLVQPPPVNDAVASAADVCGDSTLSASTWFATKETSEPAHAGAGPRRSVWYRYRPVAGQGGGTATIATVNDGVDDFDTVLAVYRGTMFTSVVAVASNDNFAGLLSQVSFSVDEAQTYWIAVDGAGFARGETDVVFDVPPAPPPVTDSLVSLCAPVRVLDTRTPGGQTVDGLHQAVGQISANTSYELPVINRGGVPADAQTVVLNVTSVLPVAAGFVTVYPCGQAVPNASNLNFAAGDVIPNSVLARVGSGGKVCLFTSATTDLLVDVSGYFRSVVSMVPLGAPGRVLDTRSPGGQTIDGLHQAVGAIDAGAIYELPVINRAGVPAEAQTVVLNVTAVLPAAAGFVTVFPCGQPTPNASNLNFQLGDVIPNSVLVRVGAGGKVCLFSSAMTDLLVDVSGYFGSVVSLTPLGAPARVLDTRSPSGQTVDGMHQAVGQIAANTTYQLPIAGRAGVPADAASVVLNVTSVLPGTAGFVTVFPCGQTVPNASNLNFAAGDVIPNSVLARLGSGGNVCLFTSAATDLLVDVSGYFGAGI